MTQFLGSSKAKLLIKLLGRVDYMTLGPGGLFAEAKPIKLFARYILRLAFRVTGTKLAVISTGVSAPIFQSKAKMFWFKRILGLHSYACFRHDIPELGGRLKSNAHVYFGTDLLNADGALPQVPFDDKRKVVVVSLANVIFENSPKHVIVDFVDKMAIILNAIAGKGYQVKLCAFDESDSPLIERVASAANNDNVIALPFDYNHAVAASWFAEAQLAICARFHAIVFSLNYRTPCIALSYDNKCEITMEQFGLSEYNTRFDTAEDTHFAEEYKLEPDKILALFDKLEANRMQAIQKIEGNIPVLRKKAAINFQVLDSLIFRTQVS
jgi:polysaccharide pyruvyl transferase WcaK-like protein